MPGTFVNLLSGGKGDDYGVMRMIRAYFGEGVLTMNGVADLQVVQRGAGANQSVDISLGDVLIYHETEKNAYYGYVKTVQNESASVTAADASNPRKDIVVAYIDLAAFDATNPDNEGALKFKCVPGTAAGSPVDPIDATIQSAVGSGNPWFKLARINRATSGGGGNTITNAVIDDIRLASWLNVKTQYPADGSITNAALDSNSSIQTFRDELNWGFPISGLVWSQVSGLNGQMTAGVHYSPSGIRLAISAIASHTFTASKDTYISIGPTGTITYSEVTTGANLPTLPSASDRWLAVVITNGSAITSVISIKNIQGFDGPDMNYLGHAVRTTDYSNGSLTAVQVPGLTGGIYLPTSRMVKVSFYAANLRNQSAGNSAAVTIWDGVVGSGTQLAMASGTSSSADEGFPVYCHAIVQPGAGYKTYNVGINTFSGGVAALSCNATYPAVLLVEAL